MNFRDRPGTVTGGAGKSHEWASALRPAETIAKIGMLARLWPKLPCECAQSRLPRNGNGTCLWQSWLGRVYGR